MPPGTIVASGSLVSPGGAQGPSGSTMPVGSVVAYCAGGAAPASWMVADGSLVSRTLYPDLFAAIGTTYGTGDGSTTFALPDLRGRTGVGAGQGAGLSNRLLGAIGGEETHVLTVTELAAHAHNYNMGFRTASVTANTTYPESADSTVAASLSSTTNNSGSGAGHNTMPPFLVWQWIIKVSVTGGPTAQAPIADSTQNGLLRQVSGNASDYVGGDNNCHSFLAPTVQRYLSPGGPGVYTTPAGCRWLEVVAVAGGGGSAGSGVSGATNGTAGNNTSFGTSLITAHGGQAPGSVGLTTGGAGGTGGTVNPPAIALEITAGGGGFGAHEVLGSAVWYPVPGPGGNSRFGGGGVGGGANSSGGAGQPNTGGGGGGAGANNVSTACTGASGGAGESIRAIIPSPVATYQWVVGAGGNAGAAGSNGQPGAAGGSGGLWITEHYSG